MFARTLESHIGAPLFRGMAAGMKQVWVFRMVHQDTGKPAQGVPVRVLEPSGNAAGYWVSEADGTVAIPRRDPPKLRLRVGLRTEDPIELDTATLGDEPIPLAAPSRLPPTSGGTRDTGERDLQAASPPAPPPPRGAEPHDVPGHVLYFQRLVLFAGRAPGAPAGPRAPAPFFAGPPDPAAPMRYRALLEGEEYWQSLR